MKMEDFEKIALAEAVEKILPLVEKLNRREWAKISAIIDYSYKMKADKVTLDDLEIKTLEKHLRHEVLDEPFIQTTPQSE